MTDDQEGKIKEGTIAEFMRKRTQLVGFEFGHWKHVQYAAEFMDNAIDAVESFQWEQLKKGSKTAFSVDKDFDVIKFGNKLNEDLIKEIEGEGYKTSEMELKTEISQKKYILTEGKPTEKRDKKKKEKLVKNLVLDMEKLLQPFENIVDIEPIVIIKLTESEAPSVLTDELGKKNIMRYTFEIFDNGTGMNRSDLRKFGIYLASSKSVKLKQTRGSQGFGAPSAFSDSQNTTGEPIIAVSKTQFDVYATASQFFTTSKNEKKYVVPHTEIETSFLHGTYIKLNYLNIKYISRYVDDYIKKTALMNPHVTIKYIDPNNENFNYSRRVNIFPSEPKYALPHPSSVNIGDFQDYITKSEHKTISSFLQDSFVRMSSKIAKTITNKAERQLEEKLNLLVVDKFYINRAPKLTSPIYLMRYEPRVWGKSTQKRDHLITYKIENIDLKKNYWELINQFNEKCKEIEEIQKKIKSQRKKFDKEKISKGQEKDIKKVITNFKNSIKKIDNEKDEVKKKLEEKFKNIKDGITEIKSPEVRKKNLELIKKVVISKTKPVEITSDQFNELFLAFKSIKYLSPPTDTAIPIGSTILKNILIDEYNLNVSTNLEDIDESKIDLQSITENETQREINEMMPKDFVAAETRSPTSGKGLAFVVEAALAYKDGLESPKLPREALLRYVNRTSKLRDSADCAIMKAAQSVKWKENYKLDVYDNGLPKGPLRLIINVSGPFVHLMFKSQSKNALAEDEILMTEIKLTLQKIGLQIKSYLNRREKIRKGMDREKKILKYIPIFVNSLYNIAKNEDKYKNKLKKVELENLLRSAIGEKPEKVLLPEVPIVEKPPIIPSKIISKLPKPAIKVPQISPKPQPEKIITPSIQTKIPALMGKIPVTIPKKTSTPKKLTTTPLISKPKTYQPIPMAKKPGTPQKITPIKKPLTKTVQTSLPIITTEKTFSILNDEWQSIKHLIFRLGISDMMDARLLQVKLKQLERENKVLVNIQSGKKYWKLKK